jgi:adenine-specific DNA-methyltransferase
VFQINDFTTNQIFESATTYTCLLFLSKHSNDRFSYQRIELGLDPKNALQKINLEPISSNKLNKKWTFNNSVKEALLDKIGKHKVTLKDISEKIFKGSSTGNDKVYLLRMISQKKQTSVVFSEILNEKIEIENKILKPFIYGLNVRRFYVNHDNIYLLFPYNIEKDKAFLIDLSKFPLTAKYLECVKKILTQRKLKFTKNDFYKYSAGRSLTEYEKEKILIPDMLVESRIGIDLLGRYYHGPAIHSLILKEQYSWLNLRYILAILSSKLFWFFISSTSTALRGNAYRLTPEYINLFPIKIINKNDKKECEKHTEIIQLVDQMLELKKQEKIETVPQSKTIIQRKITAVDNAIDKLVYALYGLTGEENKIIEKKNEEIQ